MNRVTAVVGYKLAAVPLSDCCTHLHTLQSQRCPRTDRIQWPAACDPSCSCGALLRAGALDPRRAYLLDLASKELKFGNVRAQRLMFSETGPALEEIKERQTLVE